MTLKHLFVGRLDRIATIVTEVSLIISDLTSPNIKSLIEDVDAAAYQAPNEIISEPSQLNALAVLDYLLHRELDTRKADKLEKQGDGIAAHRQLNIRSTRSKKLS